MAGEMMDTLQLAKGIPKERTLEDLYARMEVMEKINKPVALVVRKGIFDGGGH